jgi:hypothetical protein
MEGADESNCEDRVEDGGSGFLFTIGLWQTYKHPEIIVFAPTVEPSPISRAFISLARRVANGERFEPGRTYERKMRQPPPAAALQEVGASGQ